MMRRLLLLYDDDDDGDDSDTGADDADDDGDLPVQLLGAGRQGQVCCWAAHTLSITMMVMVTMMTMMMTTTMMMIMKTVTVLGFENSQEGNLLKTRGSVGTGAPLKVLVNNMTPTLNLVAN